MFTYEMRDRCYYFTKEVQSMSLESFILNAGDKRLQFSRIKAAQLKSDPTYLKYVSRIQKALLATTYWHGTGRYHYQQQGILDILASIIDNNGLKPYLDPWIDSGGKTVSLGKTRMHSRLFARVHLNDRDSMFYELGGVRYWVRLYAVLLLFWFVTNLRSCRPIMDRLFRRSAVQDLEARINTLRKSRGRRVINVLHILNGKGLCSDIDGNYPILVAITKDNLNVIDTMPLTHAVEVRTLTPVNLKNFVYIEVPFAKVAETEQLLVDKGIDLEVLPMEFVDMCMSDIPFRQLVYS